MGSGLDHPPRTTGGAESTALTTEGNQVLVAAGIALDSQEAMFEEAALQVVVKLLFDELR